MKIGKNCQIAGKVGIVGWLEITDNVTVMAGTLVTKSLKQLEFIVELCLFKITKMHLNLQQSLRDNNGLFRRKKIAATS